MAWPRWLPRHIIRRRVIASLLVLLGSFAALAVAYSGLVAAGVVQSSSVQLEAAGSLAIASASLMLVVVTWGLLRATETLADSNLRLERLHRDELEQRVPRLRAEVEESDTGYMDFVVRNQGRDPTSLRHVVVEADGDHVPVDQFRRTDGEHESDHHIQGHGKAEFRAVLSKANRISYGTPCVLTVVPLEGQRGSVNFRWGPE